MSRDQITRMDVDTGWAYHRKLRALQNLYPERWPIYWTAYVALLGEVWRGGRATRRLTLLDAWVPSMPCTPDEALQALVAARITDAEGRVPTRSWRKWVEPVLVRLEAKSAGGKAGADKRWHGGNGIPNGSPNGPTKPTKPSNQPKRGRTGARVDSGPESAGGTLRSMGFYPPGEQPPARGDQ